MKFKIQCVVAIVIIIIAIGLAIKFPKKTEQKWTYTTTYILHREYKAKQEEIIKLIPTYPQYIELDRDLVFEAPQEDVASGVLTTFTFTKGTKIYFK